MEGLIKPHERLDDLQIKGYRIIQDPKKYCFTSDAVLLSSFARARRGDVVCDFCSGSGVVGTLLYAKNPGIKKIYAVEIQEALADMARRSALLNGLSDIIEVVCAPVQRAEEILGRGFADAVVCNPPYYKGNTDMKSESEEIALAKHEIAVTIPELMRAARSVLRFGGKFYIVHQAERAAEVMHHMILNRIEPKVFQAVHARADRECHLVLIEGICGAKIGLKIKKPLYILDNNNQYTEEAKKIYSMT